MEDKLVTILGSGFFQSITDLLEKLEKYQGDGNEVQANNIENGYATSICILAVASLESYIMRCRYVNENELPLIKNESVHKYLKRLYPTFQFPDELIEIYIIRDALIHNHLWEQSFSWADEEGMKLNIAKKHKISGDKKYSNHVDLETKKTKKLRINVIPTKIDRKDTFCLLEAVWKTLIFLENKNRNQCYVSHLYVRKQNSSIRFGEVISCPETCT